MSTVRVEIERKYGGEKTLVKEYHYVPIGELEKFLKEKVYVGDVFKITSATVGAQLTVGGKPVEEIVGKKEWKQLWYGDQPHQVITVSHTDVKAIGKEGNVVYQNEPPRLIVEKVPVTTKEVQQQTTSNLQQSNLQQQTTQVKLEPTFSYGQQTATDKTLMDVIQESMSKKYIPASELQRLIEHQKAIEEYWRQRFSEDPEKAFKEYQEQLRKEEAERFKSAFVESALLSLGVGLTFPTMAIIPLAVAGIGSVSYKVVEAYNQPKEVIVPELKKVGDKELEISYRVEKSGKMGIEGVKQYLSQPEVMGTLAGATVGGAIATILRPNYKVELEIPQKLKVDAKTVVQGDKALTITEYYGKSKDVYVYGVEFQRSKVINTIDANKKLSVEFLGKNFKLGKEVEVGKVSEIASESVSKTRIYSPFHGKIYDIYSYAGPTLTKSSEIALKAGMVVDTGKTTATDLARIELIKGKSILGDATSKSTSVKIGEVVGDSAKVSLYEIGGKTQDVKFVGQAKVFQPIQKSEASVVKELGFRATDIPFETLPAEWKVSIAMAKMFGDTQTSIKQFPVQQPIQPSLSGIASITQTSTQKTIPIVITQKTEEKIEIEPKEKTTILIKPSIENVSKVSEEAKIKVVSPIKQDIPTKIEYDTKPKIVVKMPIRGDTRIDTRVNTRIDIGPKVDIKIGQKEREEITQQQYTTQINIIPPAPPQITFKKTKTPKLGLPKFDLPRSIAPVLSKEKRETTFKKVEIYKPSLYAITKNVKVFKATDFSKAFYRPMFKKPKIKVKI